MNRNNYQFPNIYSGFETYKEFQPKVPVFRLTASDQLCIHRFYDTNPVSPSGCFLAFTEFPYQDRSPYPGDLAKVVVRNLVTGKDVYSVMTAAWDTQVGAHVQWGPSDDMLFYNVLEDGYPKAVLVNIHAGTSKILDGPVYMVSPDGNTCLSADLRKMELIQLGYGVRNSNPQELRHIGAPDYDGLFATDTNTGKRRLLISYRQIVDTLPNAFKDISLLKGGLFGFHIKWHPNGKRIAFMVRWLPEGKTGKRVKNFLISMTPEAKDLRLVLGPKRWGYGHHPNWVPAKQELIMNLGFGFLPTFYIKAARYFTRRINQLGLRIPTPGRLNFSIVNEGESPTILLPNIEGSGHPSIDPSGNILVTDSYPQESIAGGDGAVPIRWIDLRSGIETHILRMCVSPDFTGIQNEWRVDPHPVWSMGGNAIIFNGCPNGKRGVFLADVRALL